MLLGIIGPGSIGLIVIPILLILLVVHYVKYFNRKRHSK
jgi:hypothetical protein